MQTKFADFMKEMESRQGDIDTINELAQRLLADDKSRAAQALQRRLNDSWQSLQNEVCGYRSLERIEGCFERVKACSDDCTRHQRRLGRSRSPQPWTLLRLPL
jgi:hypothetical protein